MKKLLALLLGLFGCVPKFVDTTTPAGVPNLVEFAPNMWRMGQPPTPAAWEELRARVYRPSRFSSSSTPVVVVKLDDEVEGNDDYAQTVLGWTVIRVPMPPEDDKIWTVFQKPDPAVVQKVVKAIIDAHEAGYVVLWHCVHGRDRTGLISALVGMKLLGWTKDYAWKNMLEHGFRWELPDLDAYWLEDVP
jgi:protein-tyrosine phosphatase